MWSSANLTRYLRVAASYFSAVEDHETLFTLDQTADAMEQFTTLIESVVPQEALTWTEDQAVEAFTSGKAIALLAGQDRMEEIAGAMEEGTWDVAAYPRGIAGVAIANLEFTGFGLSASCQNPGNAATF